MTLNVPAEFEEFIHNAVASGVYKTPEEAMRRALELLDNEQRAIRVDARQKVLPDDADPSTVARMQGVGPIQNPDAGAADAWPADESIDGWLADLQNLRGHGTPRQVP